MALHPKQRPPSPGPIPERKPEWLRVRLPGGGEYPHLRKVLSGLKLHTVCESAVCPNQGECWRHGTATFMILGDVCTRSCTFCAVRSGRPDPADADEPARVADAVNRLGLRHVVITSVTRDDLPDGGAHLFAEAVVAIRRQCPGTGIELLIPDFQGDPQALAAVVATHPDVLNHNVETIPRLYPQVRPQASFDRSIELLHRARQLHPPMLTKSGIMVGLGEERGEVVDCLKRIRNSGCDILTMGQYLRPSKAHHPVIRYYHPDEFADLRTEALALGFRHVESGPLVRSSYHAWDQFRSAETDGRPQAIPPSRSGDGTTSTSE